MWTTSFYNFVYSNYLNCEKGGKEGKEQDHKVDSIIYKKSKNALRHFKYRATTFDRCFPYFINILYFIQNILSNVKWSSLPRRNSNLIFPIIFKHFITKHWCDSSKAFQSSGKMKMKQSSFQRVFQIHTIFFQIVRVNLPTTFCKLDSFKVARKWNSLTYTRMINSSGIFSLKIFTVNLPTTFQNTGTITV